MADYGKCYRCNHELNETTTCPECFAFNHTDATFNREQREARDRNLYRVMNLDANDSIHAEAANAKQANESEATMTKTTNVKLTTAQDKLIQRLAMAQFADYKIRFLFTECSLTTFNSLIQKGIVTGEKLDHTHREGYELQLTDAGRAYATARGWLAAPVTEPTPPADSAGVDGCGFVYGDYVYNNEGERAKVFNVQGNRVTVEYDNGELEQLSAIGLRLAKKAAPASETADSAGVEAVTCRHMRGFEWVGDGWMCKECEVVDPIDMEGVFLRPEFAIGQYVKVIKGRPDFVGCVGRITKLWWDTSGERLFNDFHYEIVTSKGKVMSHFSRGAFELSTEAAFATDAAAQPAAASTPNAADGTREAADYYAADNVEALMSEHMAQQIASVPEDALYTINAQNARIAELQAERDSLRAALAMCERGLNRISVTRWDAEITCQEQSRNLLSELKAKGLTTTAN